MIRQTGGSARSATSTRSRSSSRARASASGNGLMPIWLPSGPTRRTSRARMRSLIRCSLLLSGAAMTGRLSSWRSSDGRQWGGARPGRKRNDADVGSRRPRGPEVGWWRRIDPSHRPEWLPFVAGWGPEEPRFRCSVVRLGYQFSPDPRHTRGQRCRPCGRQAASTRCPPARRAGRQRRRRRHPKAGAGPACPTQTSWPVCRPRIGPASRPCPPRTGSGRWPSSTRWPRRWPRSSARWPRHPPRWSSPTTRWASTSWPPSTCASSHRTWSRATVAIDAFGALLGALQGKLGSDEATLIQALQQLRMAYVQLQNETGEGEDLADHGAQGPEGSAEGTG